MNKTHCHVTAFVMEGKMIDNTQDWKKIDAECYDGFAGVFVTFLVPVSWGKKEFAEAIESTIIRLAKENRILERHRGEIKTEIIPICYGYNMGGDHEREGPLNETDNLTTYRIRLIEDRNIISGYRWLTGEEEFHIDGTRRIKQ